MSNSIVILDFGSQYTQLIARRVRELSVYCEMLPWDADAARALSLQPAGFILSGGPSSVYVEKAPFIPSYVLESRLPVLGICYGLQALTHALGGRVAASAEREYGLAAIHVDAANPLLPEGSQQVWMSHGDRIEQMPPGFDRLASSPNSPIAAMSDEKRKYYGVQFHPEVRHTPGGQDLLRRFVLDICNATPDWTPESIIQASVDRIRQQVGSQRVLSAVSGGVDSSVATALVHHAVGDQLSAVFINHGLLRLNEQSQVEEAFRRNIKLNLVTVDARKVFLSALAGVTDPEQKRRIIGEIFIRQFEAQDRVLGSPPFLVQGTIYPDVVESSAPERNKGARIKTHHNVGGLPKDINFKLIEPLRYLFKDEVRRVGEALGLPHELVWRQPFPGPGLAVRCLGELTEKRLDTLRHADAIFTAELEQSGLLNLAGGDDLSAAQAFAVLLPVRSVGVMGDQRTYQETVVLRAVSTDDFMTAGWTKLPYELLGKISNRIVNEVKGINRVVYDVTSKPPATIEWE
ncbi:MAG: GMP synthase (glutamine-hydrolyzing) [Anaerolinea sp.]|nr:GMP synthase (glutamine-hydrolyzing) [Anaerolinea sp.]